MYKTLDLLPHFYRGEFRCLSDFLMNTVIATKRKHRFGMPYDYHYIAYLHHTHYL